MATLVTLELAANPIETATMTQPEMLDCLYDMETRQLVGLFPCCKQGRESKHMVHNWVPRYDVRTLLNHWKDEDLEMEMERNLLKRSLQQLFSILTLFFSLLEACANKVPATFSTCCAGSRHTDCSLDYCVRLTNLMLNQTFGTTTLFYARFETNGTNTSQGTVVGPNNALGRCVVPAFVVSSYTHTIAMGGMVWTISIGILLAFGYTLSLSRTSTPLRILARQLREGKGFVFSAAPLFRSYYRFNVFFIGFLLVLFVLATLIPFVEVFALQDNVFFLAPNCKLADGSTLTAWYSIDGSKNSLSVITTCLTLLVTALFFVLSTNDMLHALANPFQSVNPETLRAHPWPRLVEDMRNIVSQTDHAQPSQEEDNSWKTYLYRSKPLSRNVSSRLCIAFVRLQASIVYALPVALLWVPIVVTEWVVNQRADVVDPHVDWEW